MKKIIALAVASAFVAPAVMAEVTVYGRIHTAVTHYDVNNIGANADFKDTRLVDQASRIGFKGTEKLDNGLQLFWQVENRVYIGDGGQADYVSNAGGWNDRDAFVGLRGKFGEVLAGKVYDSSYMAPQDYLPAFAWYNENVHGVNKFINLAQEKRILNMVRYTTPNFSGFQARGIYDFGGKTTTANYQGYQLEAWYKTQMFSVGGSYKRNNDTTKAGNVGYASTYDADGIFTPNNLTDGAKYTGYQVGANVSPIKGLDISAQWAKNISTTAADVDTSVVGFGLAAQYVTGKHNMGLQWGKLKDKEVGGVTTPNSGANAYVAQYAYKMTKQTQLIATASYLKNDSAAKYYNGTLSTTKASGGDPTSLNVAAGAKVTMISAGVRHDF